MNLLGCLGVFLCLFFILLVIQEALKKLLNYWVSWILPQFCWNMLAGKNHVCTDTLDLSYTNYHHRKKSENFCDSVSKILNKLPPPHFLPTSECMRKTLPCCCRNSATSIWMRKWGCNSLTGLRCHWITVRTLIEAACSQEDENGLNFSRKYSSKYGMYAKHITVVPGLGAMNKQHRVLQEQEVTEHHYSTEFQKRAFNGI